MPDYHAIVLILLLAVACNTCAGDESEIDEMSSQVEGLNVNLLETKAELTKIRQLLEAAEARAVGRTSPRHDEPR